jgi:hypothetical protein
MSGLKTTSTSHCARRDEMGYFCTVQKQIRAAKRDEMGYFCTVQRR